MRRSRAKEWWSANWGRGKKSRGKGSQGSSPIAAHTRTGQGKRCSRKGMERTTLERATFIGGRLSALLRKQQMRRNVGRGCRPPNVLSQKRLGFTSDRTQEREQKTERSKSPGVKNRVLAASRISAAAVGLPKFMQSGKRRKTTPL